MREVSAGPLLPTVCILTRRGYSGAVAGGRLQRLEELCEEHGIAALYAYGSRALQALHWLHRGGALAEGSNDLDLAVSGGFDRCYSLAEKVALASALSDLFEFEAIDLADMAEVDAFVAANIVRGERLYCSDRRYADELDLYILRRAGDLAPYERERLAHIESAIMTGVHDES